MNRSLWLVVQPDNSPTPVRTKLAWANFSEHAREVRMSGMTYIQDLSRYLEAVPDLCIGVQTCIPPDSLELSSAEMLRCLNTLLNDAKKKDYTHAPTEERIDTRAA